MKVIKHKDKWYLQSETGYKEILLSTDIELQKDGVHAIDDEFLEWFVKNPSCEEVEVIDDTLTVGEMSKLPLGTRNHKYKIIIQKKDSFKKECMITKIMQMDAKMAYDSLPKQDSSMQKLIDIMEADEELGLYEEPKQEKLEEVAERLYPISNPDNVTLVNSQTLLRNVLIRGAKWQQQNSYSEEEVLELLQKRTNYVLNPNTFLSDVKEWFEQFKKK